MNNEGKKRILLVEDDSFVRDIYYRKFTQEGCSVECAENGLEAMEKLKKMTPDLILLDIVMPYMDGKEVLKKIKSEEAWKNIPIALLSNLSDKEDVESGELGGADKYLIKSHFSPSEIVDKVKSLL